MSPFFPRVSNPTPPLLRNSSQWLPAPSPLLGKSIAQWYTSPVGRGLEEVGGYGRWGRDYLWGRGGEVKWVCENHRQNKTSGAQITTNVKFTSMCSSEFCYMAGWTNQNKRLVHQNIEHTAESWLWNSLPCQGSGEVQFTPTPRGRGERADCRQSIRNLASRPFADSPVSLYQK